MFVQQQAKCVPQKPLFSSSMCVRKKLGLLGEHRVKDPNSKIEEQTNSCCLYYVKSGRVAIARNLTDIRIQSSSLIIFSHAFLI